MVKKIFSSYLILLVLVFLSSCNLEYPSNIFISITNGENCEIQVGDNLQLLYQFNGNTEYIPYWKSSNDCVEVSNNGLITAVSPGTAVITATIEHYHDSIEITVVERQSTIEIILSVDKEEIEVGETAFLNASIKNIDEVDFDKTNITYHIKNGSDIASLEDNELTALASGTVEVFAKYNNIESNTLTILISDYNNVQSIELRATKYFINAGEQSELKALVYPESASNYVKYEILEGSYYGSLLGNEIFGEYSGGEIKVIARIGTVYSNEIIISVVKSGVTPSSINIAIDKKMVEVGDYATLSYSTVPVSAAQNIEFEVIDGKNNAEIIGNKVYSLNGEPFTIIGKINETVSNQIFINQTSFEKDPYEGMTDYQFYSNYKPATNYLDAYYRSLHGFMSGSIDAQDQVPTIASHQPKDGDLFIRNTSSLYSEDGNTYYILDSYGNIVNQVYRGGGYVILEEVAAYVLAFGDTPANYIDSKNANPSKNEWGEYLRLNNTYFSGDVDSYPYEPILPNIRGCGGELYYYEIDLGTTGTDCDPRYPSKIYNDGKTITRGAARIVYTRYDANGNEIIDINEKYLFYTYNHYNDFQEYLNYEGGWGEMFGNITGGGSISSNIDYNPTDYVLTTRKDFSLPTYILEDINNLNVVYFCKKEDNYLFV